MLLLEGLLLEAELALEGGCDELRDGVLVLAS